MSECGDTAVLDSDVIVSFGDRHVRDRVFERLRRNMSHGLATLGDSGNVHPSWRHEACYHQDDPRLTAWERPLSVLHRQISGNEIRSP